MKTRIIFLFALLALTGNVAMGQSKKSVSILGDSYSTYEGYVQPDTNLVWYKKDYDKKATNVTSVDQCWWHIFLNKMDMRLCVNNSYSGSTICHSGYDENKDSQCDDYSDRSFITRMDKLGSPDIIYIFGGTNDSWAKAPIGEYKYADWTKDDLYSFRPAMAYMLHEMKLRYINVDIYFILNEGLKPEINESVYTVCKHYGIEVITLKKMKKQHGHPNIEGMQSIAEQVAAYMQAK